MKELKLIDPETGEEICSIWYSGSLLTVSPTELSRWIEVVIQRLQKGSGPVYTIDMFE